MARIRSRRNARANPDRGDTDAAGNLIPKYLNTPTTDLFTKGQHLYGLPEARALLDADATPVRVEGPLDAIAVTLAGDGRYVGLAPLGTALTETQAAQLARAGRRAGGVVVATDPDAAGHAAATDDYWTLTAHGDTPRHAALPTNLDPAELLRTHGPEALRAALDTAPSLATTLISERLGSYAGRLDSPEGHVAAVRSAASVIAALPPEQWAEHIDDLDACLAHPEAGTHLEVLQAAARWIRNPRSVSGAQQAAQRRHRRQHPAGQAETASAPSTSSALPVRALTAQPVPSRPVPARRPARGR